MPPGYALAIQKLNQTWLLSLVRFEVKSNLVYAERFAGGKWPAERNTFYITLKL